MYYVNKLAYLQKKSIKEYSKNNFLGIIQKKIKIIMINRDDDTTFNEWYNLQLEKGF